MPARVCLPSAVLGACLVAGVLPSAAAGDERIKIGLQARVLATIAVDAQRVPPQLTISQDDVARGYVDVEQPLEVDFRSNHPGGVVFDFVLGSPFVAEVAAQGFEGRTALASGARVFVPQRQRGFRAHSVSLKLRLKLARGAVPGTIEFPVRVMLAPAF